MAFEKPRSASFYSQPETPRVLAYHEFSTEPSRDVYQLAPEVFAEHLQAALDLAADGRPLSEITFDDAHQSQMLLAAPLLHVNGIRGRFFVPTAWIGAKSYSADWQQLRELVEQGHTLGSHGRTHALLTQCSPEMLEEELTSSRQTLEDKLGIAVRSISMPGGRWDARVAAACVRSGYRTIYTSEPQRSPVKYRTVDGAIRVVGRLAVRRRTSLSTIVRYLEGARATHLSLRLGYMGRHLVRQAVGDDAYQNLWRQLLRNPVQRG